MAGVLSRLGSAALVGNSLRSLTAVRVQNITGVVMLSSSQHSVAAATGHSKVKAPPNAYQLFQKDPSVKAGFKNLPIAEVSKKISGRWKSLSETEKQRYADQANILKEEFEKMHGKPVTKKSKSSDRPASSYALFVKETYNEAKSKLSKNATSTDIFKEISRQWKSLSEAQKSKYKAS